MPLLSSILTRRMLRFFASRTDNVSFGSSSTMTIGKTSRLYVSDGIDFFTEFEITARLSLKRAFIDENLATIEQSSHASPFSTVLTINLIILHALYRRRRQLKRPLDNPITAYELECAFHRLCNGRTTGSDSIPAELLKYGSELLAQPLAEIINHELTTSDNIYLGDGILLRYKERIYVLGIDLLRGFYTVNHNNFVSVLKTILDDEEFRLI
ncbi:hypothetical protein DD238_007972 [Peronospora effusa]|uniref:Uncharacterized protein n=1 Tax=Peronospora effusa TaxID=542832 RepID=A0A3M6V7X2_9STRA|nr:hypothetical protein DD238_007972 [Peronospora effusa]